MEKIDPNVMTQETEKQLVIKQKSEAERVVGRDEIISVGSGTPRDHIVAATGPEYHDVQTSAFLPPTEMFDNCIAEPKHVKYVMNRSVQLDPNDFQANHSVQVDSNISLPSYHSSQEENWAEAPSDISNQEVNDFFRANRQIKDLELLRTGTDKTMINKYNEVIVSPFYNSFASKFRKDDL